MTDSKSKAAASVVTTTDSLKASPADNTVPAGSASEPGEKTVSLTSPWGSKVTVAASEKDNFLDGGYSK